MSKQNKVNKDHYVQGGRLTPDEMARERMRQAQASPRARGNEHVNAKPRARNAAPAPTPRRTSREE